MFGFEKLIVYQKAENFYTKLSVIFANPKVDKILKGQLKRSSSSVVLNIAEGSGKLGVNDKKNFYIIARGSISESVATLRLLKIDGAISNEFFSELHLLATEIGRMLTGLANNPK
ncbi:four helix bundle protein [Candidatus Peregrinibacteria bacterium CG_4_10_14_0_2_um_filter_43_11]|nr:MAG: four helix bundle protein [Candidatus Peregrinibacteria bacterium CG_4_10_14_0_2_um_filter_43_11]